MYIHMCMYIRHRALRVGCDRALILLSDFCLLLILGSLPDPDGREIGRNSPPSGRLPKIIVFATRLS